MSSGKLNLGLIDLYFSSCHNYNIKCGHLMDASNAVQCQAMALVTIVSQSKVLEVVPNLCLLNMNSCFHSHRLYHFSENLTQVLLIINPTIETFCCFPNAEVTEILLKSLVLSTGLAQRNTY